MGKIIKQFEGFNFRKTKGPKKDIVYLQLDFSGGDADTEHPEKHKFDFKFSEIDEHEDEIRKVIEDYKILKKVLDYGRDHCDNYDEVKEKFGEKIARMYDNAPNDPQSDYQYKCSLRHMTLVGYDEEGNKHESNV